MSIAGTLLVHHRTSVFHFRKPSVDHLGLDWKWGPALGLRSLYLDTLHTARLDSPPQIPRESLHICRFLHSSGRVDYDYLRFEGYELARGSRAGCQTLREAQLLEHDWVLFLHVWGYWVLVARYARGCQAWDISLVDGMGPHTVMRNLHSLCLCVLLCVGLNFGPTRRHRDASTWQRLRPDCLESCIWRLARAVSKAYGGNSQLICLTPTRLWQCLRKKCINDRKSGRKTWELKDCFSSPSNDPAHASQIWNHLLATG